MKVLQSSFTLIVALLSLLSLDAKDAYTYQTDRSFNSIHEVDHYKFCPNIYQNTLFSAYTAENEVSIEILGDSLRINGIDWLPNYHINARFQVVNNFVFDLMDSDSPEEITRMRIINDKHGHTRFLFLYSEAIGPHVFYLPERDKAEQARAKELYTAKNENFVRSYVNLLDKTFTPYQSGRYKNIPQGQETQIHFDEYFVGLQTASGEHKFPIKEATTYELQSVDFPSVRSYIVVKTKNTKRPILVYLNFKQEIECIEVEGQRYFLHS